MAARLQVTLFWHRLTAFFYVNQIVLRRDKSREVRIKTRSPPASLPFKGQVTDRTIVTWFIRKRLTPLSHPIGSKSKPIVTGLRTFSRTSCKLCAYLFRVLIGSLNLLLSLWLVKGCCVGLDFTTPVELHFFNTSIWNRSCQSARTTFVLCTGLWAWFELFTWVLFRMANYKAPCKRSRLPLLHSIAPRLPTLRFFERIK